MHDLTLNLPHYYFYLLVEKPLGFYFRVSWQVEEVQPPPKMLPTTPAVLHPAKHEKTKMFWVPPFAVFFSFFQVASFLEGACGCHEFGLLTIRWHSTARKHQFLYPQGDRSSLRKPKMNKQH